MVYCYRVLTLIPLFMVAVSSANAGTLANEGWAPSKCGAAPAEFKLDLRDPDAFNRSVEGVNAYRQASLTYVDCLAREANADIQAITQSAKTAQQAALDADAKIKADVKLADQKFGK
jgi:hypothetical protein